MAQAIYILIGPPGSGKGTQTELLHKLLDLEIISTGKIMREESTKKTVTGKRIASYIKRGLLVPNDIVAQAVIRKMKKTEKSVVLDGFPRNLTQAKLLDEYLRNLNTRNFVIELYLQPKKILQRITGRLTCHECGANFHETLRPPLKKGICDLDGGKLFVRADSKPEIVKSRIEIYQYETRPIIEYYKQEPAYIYKQIDAGKNIDSIQSNLVEIITKLK